MREKLCTTSGLKLRTARDRASVLRTVSDRERELSPGQGKNASLGHSEPGRATSPTVCPAARSRRTSTSTMRSMPP